MRWSDFLVITKSKVWPKFMCCPWTCWLNAIESSRSINYIYRNEARTFTKNTNFHGRSTDDLGKLTAWQQVKNKLECDHFLAQKRLKNSFCSQCTFCSQSAVCILYWPIWRHHSLKLFARFSWRDENLEFIVSNSKCSVYFNKIMNSKYALFWQILISGLKYFSCQILQ